MLYSFFYISESSEILKFAFWRVASRSKEYFSTDGIRHVHYLMDYLNLNWLWLTSDLSDSDYESITRVQSIKSSSNQPVRAHRSGLRLLFIIYFIINCFFRKLMKFWFWNCQVVRFVKVGSWLPADWEKLEIVNLSLFRPSSVYFL